MEITQGLMNGVENLLTYASIRQGDHVLILVDTMTNDPDLVKLIREMSLKKGAGYVDLLEIQKPEYVMGDPHFFLGEAIKYTDVILNFSNLLVYTQPTGLTATSEYGTKLVRVDIQKAYMLDSEFCSFPSELLYAIVGKTAAKVAAGKKLRIRSDQGTDLTCGINPFAISGGHSPRVLPGERVIFPGGMVGINPQDPDNGVLVLDFIFPSIDPPEIALEPKPMIIEIKDRKAVRIEGTHADWLLDLLKTKGDANAWYHGELMWGNHPKGYPLGWPEENPWKWFMVYHYRSDTLHNALGRGICNFPPFSNLHLDFYQINATLEVDGEPIIDHGHHLIYDDPEIIKIAEKYGDPKQLLSLTPLPPNFLPERHRKKG